jgi:hypothetical protein
MYIHIHTHTHTNTHNSEILCCVDRLQFIQAGNTWQDAQTNRSQGERLCGEQPSDLAVLFISRTLTSELPCRYPLAFVGIYNQISSFIKFISFSCLCSNRVWWLFSPPPPSGLFSGLCCYWNWPLPVLRANAISHQMYRLKIPRTGFASCRHCFLDQNPAAAG